jgi:hypothetical protein
MSRKLCFSIKCVANNERSLSSGQFKKIIFKSHSISLSSSTFECRSIFVSILRFVFLDLLKIRALHPNQMKNNFDNVRSIDNVSNFDIVFL